MSNSRSLYYYGEELAVADVRKLTLAFKITGAKTVVPMPSNNACLTTFDAISAQSVIDDFLGTTNEFLVAAFDSTAMGADTFAVIVQCQGQAGKLAYGKAVCYSGTGGGTVVERVVVASTTLTASTLATECAKGAYGNLAMKVDFGNSPDFDGLTSGVIEIELAYLAK